jgi:hypothetical protein
MAPEHAATGASIANWTGELDALGADDALHALYLAANSFEYGMRPQCEEEADNTKEQADLARPELRKVGHDHLRSVNGKVAHHIRSAFIVENGCVTSAVRDMECVKSCEVAFWICHILITQWSRSHNKLMEHQSTISAERKHDFRRYGAVEDGCVSSVARFC